MKWQYYIVVNVVIHISKSKGVAEMTNKTNKIKIKKGLSKVTSFTIHHVYSYREVPMFSLNLLKCPYHQFFFYFPIWFYMSCSEHLRKTFFYLDKKRFCYKCLKTWKFYFLAVDQGRWSQHRHAQSCDVDSGTCDFRFDLSRLFYLFKFSLVFHAKCSFPACLQR